MKIYLYQYYNDLFICTPFTSVRKKKSNKVGTKINNPINVQVRLEIEIWNIQNTFIGRRQAADESIYLTGANSLFVYYILLEPAGIIRNRILERPWEGKVKPVPIL